MQKMQYTLLRENHIIEKGMSIRQTHHAFGHAKVAVLIKRLRKYQRLYGQTDRAFLYYPISTIKAYIDYQHNDNVEIPDIEHSFTLLCGQFRLKGLSRCDRLPGNNKWSCRHALLSPDPAVLTPSASNVGAKVTLPSSHI